MESVTIINRVANIYQYAFDYCTSVIRGFTDSTAQSYAGENGFNFVALNGCDYGHHAYQLVDEQTHTDTKAGWKHYRCADCGAVTTMDVPAGHLYNTYVTYNPETGNFWMEGGKCIYCGKSIEGDTSSPLKLNERIEIELPEGLTELWFRFTPEKSGMYELTSFACEDIDVGIQGTLSDSAQRLWADNYYGEFCLTPTLTAGQTYYFEISYDSALRGRIALDLTEYAYSGACGDDLQWSFDPDSGALTITGSGKMWQFPDKVPWDECREMITTVQMADGLTSISDYAFRGCNSLISVSIPNSVKTIGAGAFKGCDSLAGITIPENVKRIGYDALLDCTGLKSVRILSLKINIPYHAIGFYRLETQIDEYNYTYETLKTDGVTIYAYADSTAQSYAEEIGLAFIRLDENNTCINNHDFGVWVRVKAPSCTKRGVEARTCSRCGETEVRQLQLPGNNNGHDFGEWTQTKAPTCTAFGVETRTCSRCGEIETRELAMIPHSYENGVCSICGAKEQNDVPPVSFTDVSPTAYYADAVSWAVEKNITNGTGDGKFSPSDTCTRGQVVAFLWRAFGQPKPTSTNNPFTDVKEGKYYYDAVLWAVENGITSGTGDGRFSPNGECTRGQVVTFLWRAAGKPAPQQANNPFADVKTGAYYYDAVLWAVGQGVTKGTTDTTFSPNQTCTRGQVVTFLFRDLV